MDHVEAEQQGNAEAGFVNGETLDGAHLIGAPEIEQGADSPRADPLV